MIRKIIWFCLVVILVSFNVFFANCCLGQNSHKVIVAPEIHNSGNVIKYQGVEYGLLLVGKQFQYYDLIDSVGVTVPLFYFPDSLPNGLYIIFYDKEYSKPLVTVSFKNNKIDSLMTTYHRNGKINRSYYFINGKSEGFGFVYDESGNLKELTQFESGKKNGIYLSFYDLLHPEIICTYKKGVLEGEYKYWKFDIHANYLLDSHILYKNGKQRRSFK